MPKALARLFERVAAHEEIGAGPFVDVCQLEAMTQTFEAGFPEPWSVANASADFTERLITQIVGIEIGGTRLQGKWNSAKTSRRKTEIA